MGLPTTYHSSIPFLPYLLGSQPQSHTGHSSFPAWAFGLLPWSIDLLLSLLMVEQRGWPVAAEPVAANQKEKRERTPEGLLAIFKEPTLGTVRSLGECVHGVRGQGQLAVEKPS